MALNPLALVDLVQAKSYLRIDAAASLKIEAEFVGMGDGTNKVFTLDWTPLEGSLRLYVNGVLQIETTHFSIISSDITFITAPTLNHPVTASYDKAASANTFESYDDDLLERLIEAATKKAEDYTGRAFVQGEITENHWGDGLRSLKLYRQPIVSISSVSWKTVDNFEGDGLTKVFPLGKTPMASSYSVYVDGVLKTKLVDYSISGSMLTFVIAPGDGALIIVHYTVPLVLNTDYTEQLSIGRLKGSWEQTYEYQVIYIAGYGADRAATQALIPDAVTAVLIAVANWYSNRLGIKSENIAGVGSVDYGEADELPPTSKKLLNSLRVSIL